MARQTITLYYCDHPSCDKAVQSNREAGNNPLPVTGYYGHITDAAVNHDRKFHWFACSHKHITGAIRHILGPV